MGKVAHFWDVPGVFKIEMTGSESVKVGDTIGYAFNDRFKQETVTSLQVDTVPIEEVVPGNVSPGARRPSTS